MSWIGSAISAGASFLGGLISNNSQRKAVKEQIRAQELENQRNREYNLMLAQQQNAWNVEQWERENEYNDPAAQMKRFKNAGLNPDLMAGSGAQNLSAPSPTMTAGAPSTPQDMSTLGRRPNFGEAVQIALRDSMIGAQIDNIKAQTRKTLAESGVTEIQAKYEDAKQKLGLDISRQQFEANKLQYEKLVQEVEQAKALTSSMGSDAIIKGIEAFSKSEKTSHELKILANQAKISEQEAKFAVESYVYRMLGLELDVKHQKYLEQFEYLLQDGKTADSIMRVLAPVGSFLRQMFIK